MRAAKLTQPECCEEIYMRLRRGLCARFVFALVPLLIGIGARADGPDVRKLLTPEQFHAAGLDKLTEQEIDALNRWLVTYTARDAPEVRRSDVVVQKEVEKIDTEGTRTRIAGEFTGWTGETVFRLENGQVWKQRLPGRWSYHADSPEVELRKNMMGFWVLRVVDADHSVGVTRVK
jgi:hypothetical protein